MYIRENALTDPLDTWLASAFELHRPDQAITAMAHAQPPDQPPTPATAAQAIISSAAPSWSATRPSTRAPDPALVTNGSARPGPSALAPKAEVHTDTGDGPRRMSRTEIAILVDALGDIVTVLRDADPADKAEVYRQVGLRLTYQAETQTVRAAVDLSAHRGVMVRVRGATRSIAPPLRLAETICLG